MLSVVSIWVAVLTCWSVLRAALPPTGLRLRVWPVLLWCAVAVPSLLQVAVLPALLTWGERDPEAIRAGQWWRLVTSIVLQDGGWGGTAFNLVLLAITAVLLGSLCRPLPVVLTFLGGGVGSNVLTMLILQEAGAGNSMATLCLLAAATVVVGRSHLRSPVALLAWALLGGATLTLILAADQHGLALALGLACGAGLTPFLGRF